jgi:hypothetical protein
VLRDESDHVIQKSIRRLPKQSSRLPGRGVSVLRHARNALVGPNGRHAKEHSFLVVCTCRFHSVICPDHMTVRCVGG